jgi:hypothetical protein
MHWLTCCSIASCSEAEVVTKEAQRVANFGRLKQLINKASKPIMPDIPVLPFKVRHPLISLLSLFLL